MKIKMICSVITKDLVSLQHNGVYTLEKELAMQLIKANYAIEVKEPEKQVKKSTRQTRQKKSDK